MKWKYILFFIILLLISAVAYGADYQVDENMNLNENSIYNTSEVNATTFYQNGNAVIDSASVSYTTDTNATTECSAGEYLDGAGTCVNTNATISDLDTDTNTNAETECSGDTTYYDGEGNCDDISSVYAPINYGDDWNETYANTLYANISVTTDNSSWNETYASTLYRADSWDNFTGIPTASPSNGDSTHLSTADHIYDWVNSNPFSWITNAVNDLTNYYTKTESDTFNTSMTTYVNAQDVIYNTTMTTYTDAQDVIYNTSMTTYVNAEDVVYNTTQTNYVDGLISGLSSLYCALAGCTMAGDIAMGNNDITGASDINSSEFYQNDNLVLDTADTFSGEVSGTYDNIVLGHDALDDQYVELGDSFSGEVTGTYDNTVVGNDALDDQYIELGDTFVGDVSGTYDATVVADDSHTHAYQNITNEPWIEDSQESSLNVNNSNTTDYWDNTATADDFVNIIASGNLTVSGSIIGQPITGAIGSGIIDCTENIAHCGCMNVTVNQDLEIRHPEFTARVIDTDGTLIDCYKAAADMNITDDLHSTYYLNLTCDWNSESFSTFHGTDMSPGGRVRIFDVLAINGIIEETKGNTLLSLAKDKTEQVRIFCSSSSHLSVCSGFDITTDTFPSFNVSSGYSVYLNTYLPSDAKSTLADESHHTHHTNGAWVHTNVTGLNITHCDNSTDLVECTGASYRQYPVYSLSWNSDATIHQLAPLTTGATYANLAACKEGTPDYVLPASEEYVAVVHHIYCAKRTDSSWIADAWVDLRIEPVGAGGTQDLSIYLSDYDFPSAGLMKTDGSGTYSAITDSSTNWDSAFTWTNTNHTNWDNAYLLRVDTWTSPLAFSSNTASLTACADTEIYKYNGTSSAWECEADDSAGSYSFNLTADSGTVQQIDSTNIVDIAGGTNGIDTVVGATDTVTINLDWSEVAANAISEAKIDMDTSCAAGNHLYVSGDDFACEADDDTTYTAEEDIIYLDSTTFKTNYTVLNATINAEDDDTTYVFLKDLVGTSPVTINGGTNVDNIIYGADADITIAVTLLKDLVAGDGLNGGANDVLVGADADVTFTFDCSDVVSTGIQCTGEDLQLNTTYTGTLYQPLEATLTDIADGTITENLVNTDNPWADNEVSDTLTVTGYMQDEDINTFSEIQAWVADKTLVNEEDIFTIDANWVNTANPWDISTETNLAVGNGITITGDTLTVVGGTAITADAGGVSITADAVGDTQLAFNTGQHLTTLSSPEFASLNTGQGSYEMYAMNQDIESTDAVTFLTIDTGFGANELYDMDQHVLTTSDVKFNLLNITSNFNILENKVCYDSACTNYEYYNGTCFVRHIGGSTLNHCPP